MDVKCAACGRLNPVPAAKSGDKVAVTCHHCGSRFQVFIPSGIGAETVFQPQLLADGLGDELEKDEAGDGAGEASTQFMGSGTVVLDSKESHATPLLETVVQGFLILVGAMPGEERFPLVGTKTVVGRKGAHIVIDDPALSSHHFEVEATGDEFFIRDLDSTNGTEVNDTTIGVVRLADGDTIQAGQTKLIFRALKAVPLDGPR